MYHTTTLRHAVRTDAVSGEHLFSHQFAANINNLANQMQQKKMHAIACQMGI